MSNWKLITGYLLAMTAATAGSAVVGLSVEQARSLPAPVLTEMRKEAGRILQPAGVRIRWIGIETESQSRDQARLVVVKLVGTSSFGIALHGSVGVLAVTHISEGRILPFIDIDVDRVARAAQRFGGSGRAIHPVEYGRALGRVLAHELYHVLSGSELHDAYGVAKSALGGAELVGSELRLSAGSCRRIREALGLTAEP